MLGSSVSPAHRAIPTALEKPAREADAGDHARGHQRQHVNQAERLPQPVDARVDRDNDGQAGDHEFACSRTRFASEHEGSELPNESRLSCGAECERSQTEF